MDRKEKMDKKKYLKQYFEFGKDRFSDNEINILLFLVNNIEKFIGASKNANYSHEDWDLDDGKYTRHYDETYTIERKGSKIICKEEGSYRDDAGPSIPIKRIITDAKELVRIIEKYFIKR